MMDVSDDYLPDLDEAKSEDLGALNDSINNYMFPDEGMYGTQIPLIYISLAFTRGLNNYILNVIEKNVKKVFDLR